ncbi:MAG: hypothetical protein BGN86_00060 [Caulobacterales bacterium 68-7]|nr:MAG: hypothetical protein BGN86_00060 [Caulobacterales bacterium 68-7]
MSDDLAARYDDILRRTPGLMEILRQARALALPDWLVVSGAVYQPVWNALTDRPLDHGLKDYDLAYFDASDISYEAEDVVIKRAAAVLPPPLDTLVEVRNQARVHLWFEQRFGEPYAPLASSAEALTRFLSPAFSIGVRLEADDRLHVEAPYGLEDLFALRLRPNPDHPRGKGWDRVAEGVKARWPEVTVEA